MKSCNVPEGIYEIDSEADESMADDDDDSEEYDVRNYSSAQLTGDDLKSYKQSLYIAAFERFFGLSGFVCYSTS